VKTSTKNQKEANFEHETYFHVYNSGVDGRILFNSKEDFDRFEAYLYLLNAVEGQRAANFFTGNRAATIFESARGELLVSIAAYAVTPREYHLLISANAHAGISKFMQKLQTAYTMFFNKKYQRAGRLFQSSYRSKSAQSTEHLKYLFAYVHLHPASIFDAGIVTGNVEPTEMPSLVAKALHYRYSSVNEYTNGHVITKPDAFPPYLQRMKDGATLLRAFQTFQSNQIKNRTKS